MESVEFAYADNMLCHGDCSNMLVEEFLNDDFLSDVKEYETEEKGKSSIEKLEERMDFYEENNNPNSPVLCFEEFPIPDMKELEWVSSIIHENPESEFPKTETLKPKPEPRKPDLKLEPQEHTQPLTVAPIEARAKRSKRNITYKGPWTTSSSTSSSSSLTTSSTSSCSSYSSQVLFMRYIFDEIPAPTRNIKKKRGRKPKSMLQQQTRGVVGATERRCMHCGSTKTPQWRAGPSGAKTLCNACGVRYKSGRLLPEYRPACSPTFSSNVHSNSHRKVLEMRRKKELKDERKFDYVHSALPVASF